MSIETITSENAPPALGPYSQAIKSGGFLFISGQLPLSAATGEFVSDEIEMQTRQCLENLKSILLEAGTSLSEVVKVTVFLKDMNDFGAMNKIYAHYFDKQPPARCCVEVARLPLDVMVEIEAIARVDEN